MPIYKDMLGCSKFVQPTSFEFQDVHHEDSVEIHDNISLIFRLENMQLSQSLVDRIGLELQQLPDTGDDQINQAISKLSTKDQADFAPSRYIQTEAEKKMMLSALMDKLSVASKKFEDEIKQKDFDEKFTSIREKLFKELDIDKDK